ncbi:MAG: TIR domain-containing protein [Sedimenticola sp.]
MRAFNRPWVRHEIKRSYELGKGLLGIYIHNVKDPIDGTDLQGKNPLDYWSVKRGGINVPFSRLYRTYDWVHDDGYSNLARWIEDAAKAAGR